MLLEPIIADSYTKQQPEFQSQLVEREYDEIGEVEEKTKWAALDTVGMAADGIGWYDTEIEACTSARGFKCHWQNAVVASMYEGGKALHILVI